MGDLEGRVALEGREQGLAMQTFYLRKLSRRLSCMAVLWSLLVVVKGGAGVPAVVAGKVCVACYCISQCAAFLSICVSPDFRDCCGGVSCALLQLVPNSPAAGALT